MRGKIGVSTRLRSVAPPNLRRLKQTITLPKAAALRLRWMDFYRTHSNNAALTARHFGVAKSCFFKWKQRYDRLGPKGLVDQPKRPKQVRQPLTPLPVVDAVRSLRKLNPEFSKYKLQVVLEKDYGYHVSASSIGRIISRYQLFFSSPVKPKRHPGRHKHIGVRKPYGLKATAPGQLIEVDVKHLPGMGNRRYGFCAIDTFTKQATIHVAGSISSAQAAVAWRKAVQCLGVPAAVLTDNGSENLGAFSELVSSQRITHYLARPHTPKDKPYIERFISTLEKECIQWGGYSIDLAEQREIVDAWLAKYHSYRPHQGLGYLTPDEFVAKLKA